jgi:glycosyltransferase involved in cell wall biosynthesis
VSRPTVHLYTVCWNEADLLGFFFRHYDPWVDRYVVYDDGSTDGTVEILRAHPRVELRRFERAVADSFVLSHQAVQDEAWKESRGRADWIVFTDIDEHLHAGRQPMAAYLAGPEARQATLLPALGFDMNHPALPDDHGLLVERVTIGRPRAAFNKLGLFRPDAIRETRFAPGRHSADPVGDLRLPPQDAVMLWHYKHLGFDRCTAREAEQWRRRGATDIAKGYGEHYRWPAERRRAFWDEMVRESTDLAAPGFAPQRACVRPLWWEERPGMLRRPLPPVAAAPRAEPRISILVKAYNHAPFVRQAIESVLAEPVQDLEIVVTDDGSSDGTQEILRGYAADPRIRLEAFPENRGIPVAMNATVARARGRYLAILNSDDYLLPGRLERQAAFLDAHPEVSLVFGQPQPVDEAGRPAAPYNDFRAPLGWPDFSRRRWLRQFFLAGNCLCSPTAMIRREAYAEAGPYDARLTNLQDLDMWIRMLACGHAIHLLPDAVTAFRIRAAQANMSAPRRDTRLRTCFEWTRILHRFAEFSPALIEEVFGEADGDGAAAGTTVPLRVAAIAAGVARTEHRLLALELLHAHAATAADLARLRQLAGTLDAFNIEAMEAVPQLLEQLQHLTGRCEAAEAALREAEEERGAMRRSLSWRITAPLRWVRKNTRM